MNYSIRAFDPNEDTIKPFDCGDHDLNGFLLERGNESPNAEVIISCIENRPFGCCKEYAAFRSGGRDTDIYPNVARVKLS